MKKSRLDHFSAKHSLVVYHGPKVQGLGRRAIRVDEPIRAVTIAQAMSTNAWPFVGRSDGLVSVFWRARALAAEPSRHIGILGERGTGKMHLAKLIHSLSPGEGSLVRLSAKWGVRIPECKTLAVSYPEALPEQEQLLLPWNRPRPRLILITTSRASLTGDLDRAVEWLTIPPLRERLDDIEPIAMEYLRRKLRRKGDLPSMPPETLAVLQQWRWPGNVIELQYVLDHVCKVAGRRFPKILVKDLPRYLRPRGTRYRAWSPERFVAYPNFLARTVKYLFQYHEGDGRAVASHLGISPRTLALLRRELGIPSEIDLALAD